MTNKELIQKFEVLVLEEKKATRLVLEHIAMIESRRAYFDLGYDGMYSYMVKGLGYSEASAHRRIMASRALKIDNSIGEKLEKGSLNLTQLAQVTQLSRQAKIQPSLMLFEKLEHKGKSATEQILAETFDIKPKEITHTRTQRDESVRLEVTFTKEQFEALQKAKSHLSHICPDGDWSQVLTELAKRLNQKFQPKITKKPERMMEVKDQAEVEILSSNILVPKPIKTPPAGFNLKLMSKRKNFGLPMKRILLNKAHGHCQFKDPKTGRQCCSNYQLQIDHLMPISKGGSNEINNLQILCGVHNRLKGSRL